MTTRRTFVVVGGTVALGGAGIAWRTWYLRGPDEPITVARAEPRPPTGSLDFDPFDPVARAVLVRLYDDLIPGDAELPSASQADVIKYVEEMAVTPGFREVRTRLVKLARWLNLESNKQSGGPYDELPDADRSIVLETAAGLPPRDRGFDASGALRLAMQAGLEGYLGHPRHRERSDFGIWEHLDIRMPRDPKESQP